MKTTQSTRDKIDYISKCLQIRCECISYLSMVISSLIEEIALTRPVFRDRAKQRQLLNDSWNEIDETGGRLKAEQKKEILEWSLIHSPCDCPSSLTGLTMADKWSFLRIGLLTAYLVFVRRPPTRIAAHTHCFCDLIGPAHVLSLRFSLIGWNMKGT